jgi:hypothetical protein
MEKTRIILTAVLFLGSVCAGYAEEETYSRQVLLAPMSDTTLSPERYFAELDLNGDGINELIVSESVSLGGTGGLVYSLYLGIGQDRFLFMDRFLSGIMTIETRGKAKRLWSYSHSSAASGTIQYYYFDIEGVFQRSHQMMIYPGDGGSLIGNMIYHAIFSEDKRLQFRELGTSESVD